MTRGLFSFLIFLGIVSLAWSFGDNYPPGEWYELIRKPSWIPPIWLSRPLWVFLYLSMAVAAWQAWEEKHPLSGRAVSWWLGMLLLNGAWIWLLFGFFSPGLALIDLSVLLIVISATIRLFKRVKPSAATLLTPYLVWVSYLWFLNLSIWWMNGGGLGVTDFLH